MAWYKEYLNLYDCPPDKIFPSIFEKVSWQLKLFQNGQFLVTVSVIAYNEEKRLVACLWSLSEMVCKYPVEIIGVNNNSTDRTEKSYKALGIPYYNEEQKGSGSARQCGLSHAKGKYHICIDADTLYPHHYVKDGGEIEPD